QTAKVENIFITKEFFRLNGLGIPSVNPLVEEMVRRRGRGRLSRDFLDPRNGRPWERGVRSNKNKLITPLGEVRNVVDEMGAITAFQVKASTLLRRAIAIVEEIQIESTQTDLTKNNENVHETDSIRGKLVQGKREPLANAKEVEDGRLEGFLVEDRLGGEFEEGGAVGCEEITSSSSGSSNAPRAGRRRRRGRLSMVSPEFGEATRAVKTRVGTVSPGRRIERGTASSAEGSISAESEEVSESEKKIKTKTKRTISRRSRHKEETGGRKIRVLGESNPKTRGKIWE
ncbi:Unknown protein, partial [Striga hermonthica]